MRTPIASIAFALMFTGCGESATTAPAETRDTRTDLGTEDTSPDSEADVTPDSGVAADTADTSSSGDAQDSEEATDTVDTPDTLDTADTVDPNACTIDEDCAAMAIAPPNACVAPRCIDRSCQLGERLCGDTDPCTLDACDPRMGCLNVPITVDVGPSQFRLCPTAMTQPEAQAACQEHESELASIDSEADALAVAALLLDTAFDSAFVTANGTYLCPGKRVVAQLCRSLPADGCPIDESCGTAIPFVCEIHCNDGDPCTRDRVGSNGLCVFEEGGCDDGDPCTTDTCDLRDGCLHTPITGCPADP
jgi:hypothetical protein